MHKPFPPARIEVRIAVLLVVAAGLTCAGDAQANGPATPRSEVKNVFWQPNDVKQGSPVLITAEVSGPAREVNGIWLGKRVRFWHSEKPHVWEALAGVDLDQQPGNSDLKVSAKIGGRIAQLTKPIQVNEAQFGTGDVRVAQDYVNPTPDEQRQIAHDEALKKSTFSRLTPRPLWNGDFRVDDEGLSKRRKTAYQAFVEKPRGHLGDFGADGEVFRKKLR